MGQFDLFGGGATPTGRRGVRHQGARRGVGSKQRLALEREMLGLYVSGHPRRDQRAVRGLPCRGLRGSARVGSGAAGATQGQAPRPLHPRWPLPRRPQQRSLRISCSTGRACHTACHGRPRGSVSPTRARCSTSSAGCPGRTSRSPRTPNSTPASWPPALRSRGRRTPPGARLSADDRGLAADAFAAAAGAPPSGAAPRGASGLPRARSPPRPPVSPPCSRRGHRCRGAAWCGHCRTSALGAWAGCAGALAGAPPEAGALAELRFHRFARSHARRRGVSP